LGLGFYEKAYGADTFLGTNLNRSSDYIPINGYSFWVWAILWNCFKFIMFASFGGFEWEEVLLIRSKLYRILY